MGSLVIVGVDVDGKVASLLTPLLFVASVMVNCLSNHQIPRSGWMAGCANVEHSARAKTEAVVMLLSLYYG